MIKKGDVVSISGIIHNSDDADDPLYELPFIEELAVQIRKKRAFPFLELSTENLKKRFFQEMPQEVYSADPHYYKNWIDTIDFFIEIGWENFSNRSHSDGDEKVKRIHDTMLYLIEHFISQHKKMIFLNFPDQELALITDQKLAELQKIYLRVINCDYNYLNLIGNDLNENLISFQNYLIYDEDHQLNFKTIRNAHTLYAGNIKDRSIITLPSGFIELQLDREEINGEFRGEKVYYKDKILENVKLKFEAGTVRYVVFKENNENNFVLQNELMNSLSNCLLTIGFNDEIINYTNYFYYDRCIKNNHSLIFFDRNSEPIVISNKNLKMKKRH